MLKRHLTPDWSGACVVHAVAKNIGLKQHRPSRSVTAWDWQVAAPATPRVRQRMTGPDRHLLCRHTTLLCIHPCMHAQIGHVHACMHEDSWTATEMPCQRLRRQHCNRNYVFDLQPSAWLRRHPEQTRSLPVRDCSSMAAIPFLPRLKLRSKLRLRCLSRLGLELRCQLVL